jgi:ribosomal protein S18 acetylase RimI-like enzyme
MASVITMIENVSKHSATSLADGASIRPAQAGDAGAVAALYLAVRRQEMAYAPLQHSDAEVQQWLRDVLIPAGNCWLLVDHQGDLLGLISVSVDVGSRGWIDQLYLSAESRGRGLGSELLWHALGLLPRPVQLYTFEPNVGAQRFYERHGFALVARGDGRGNEEGCPDLLMQLG